MTMRKSLEAQPPTHTRGGVKKEQQRDFSCNHCGEEFIVVVKLRSGKMTRFVRFVVSKWRLRLCESVSPDNASQKIAFFCRWNEKKSILIFLIILISIHQHATTRIRRYLCLLFCLSSAKTAPSWEGVRKMQLGPIILIIWQLHSDQGYLFVRFLQVITTRIVWFDDISDEHLPFDCFNSWNVHKTLSQSQHGYLLDLFPYQWLFDGNHHCSQSRP